MYYENPDGVSVHDGFPNPASDVSLQSIDLNSLLIRHTASTYFMRVAGNDWVGQGIYAGDLAIVDRALGAKPNDPVVWIHEEDFAISPRHKLPERAIVWGTVTSVIHQYRGKS